MVRGRQRVKAVLVQGCAKARNELFAHFDEQRSREGKQRSVKVKE